MKFIHVTSYHVHDVSSISIKFASIRSDPFRFALIRFAQPYSDSLHLNPIYSTLICSISIRSIPLHSALRSLHFNPIYFFTLIHFWLDSFRLAFDSLRLWFVSNHFSLLRSSPIWSDLLYSVSLRLLESRVESSRVELRAKLACNGIVFFEEG